jgi:hypothetical protein
MMDEHNHSHLLHCEEEVCVSEPQNRQAGLVYKTCIWSELAGLNFLVTGDTTAIILPSPRRGRGAPGARYRNERLIRVCH